METLNSVVLKGSATVHEITEQGAEIRVSGCPVFMDGDLIPKARALASLTDKSVVVYGKATGRGVEARAITLREALLEQVIISTRDREAAQIWDSIPLEKLEKLTVKDFGGHNE